MKIFKNVSPIYPTLILILLLCLVYVIPNIIGLPKLNNNEENPNGPDPPTNNNTIENPNGPDPPTNNNTIENPPNNITISQLKVSGRNIVDESGQNVNLTGFYIWTQDILKRINTVEKNLKKIKESGFNTILISLSWSSVIETDKEKNGFYDKENIALIERAVQSAQKEGLYVIMSLRVSSSDSTSQPDRSWGGWAYADMFTPNYTDNWDDYFTRFLNAWEYIINKFDEYDAVIGYDLWYYPFHGKDPETGNWNQPTHKINHYEQVLTPRLLSMLRENSEKIYFWTPVDQGGMMTPEFREIIGNGTSLGEISNDPTSSTGQYQPGFNRVSTPHEQNVERELTPLNDTNVVYCAEGHRPRNVELLEQTPLNWTGTYYQKLVIDASYSSLNQFMEKYQVPGMITEMGMHNPRRGAEQWRIDAYDYKMQKINEYGIHWVYMWSGNEHPVDLHGEWNNVGEMLIRNIP